MRYREPVPKLRQLQKWIGLGFFVWALWVLFLSDHSVLKLLHLHAEKENLVLRNNIVQEELVDARRDLPSSEPTSGEIERHLREKHLYAKDGEIVYLFGSDSTRTVR